MALPQGEGGHKALLLLAVQVSDLPFDPLDGLHMEVGGNAVFCVEEIRQHFLREPRRGKPLPAVWPRQRPAPYIAKLS